MKKRGMNKKTCSGSTHDGLYGRWVCAGSVVGGCVG